MSKCKRIFAVFVTLVLVALSVYPVFSEETESHTVSVINTVGLDNIHIEINEYDIVNGQREEIASNPTVLPAQVINRVCEISNLANEAWIRVKVVYAEDAPDVGENFLTISSEKWKKCGEYYYYTESVPNNGVVEFFNKINIPKDWDSSYARKTISFTVHADAVQKQNFTPDFYSQDPWFGTVIEHRVHDDYIVPTEKGNQQFQIIYQDGAEGLVKVGDDFFSNWSTLMPGDVEKDRVTLKNNYALPTTIYFKINDIDDSELLKQLQLRIYTEYDDIYNGSLLGNIKDEIELATLKQGEELEIFYELKVPSELTNEFSLTKTKTEWVFRAYAENMAPPSPDATGYVNPNNPQNRPTYFNGNSPVQTGDAPVIISIALAAVVCILAIYIIVVRGGGNREQD